MYIHTDTIIPYELKTIEGPKGRFYITPENNKYPSITTVLGSIEKPWLTDWKNSLGPQKVDKELKRTSERGTAVHLMIEKHLNNESDPTEGQKLEHIREFTSVKPHLKHINNILTQETALWSDQLKIAGRVDCIAEFKKKLSIIDFKTSTNNKITTSIQDYFLQTTAYSLMFEERYSIQIDEIIIIMSVETGLPLIFKSRVEEHIEPLLYRINNYYTNQNTKNG